MAFQPDKAIEWGNQDFAPKETQRWAFIGISSVDGRTLREARWNPDSVHLWGPFKSWTPEIATKWKSNGYTHKEMKYWPGINKTMVEVRSWQAAGVTTQPHKTLDNSRISLPECEKWRHVTSLAEVAIWIANGFTPTTATQWMENKVFPADAAFLNGKLSPSDVARWTKEGIQADLIQRWRDLLPDPVAAGLFLRNKFSPEQAAEWYNIGASVLRADIFRQG
ncbi:hypothetical protein DSO57_1026004 [Entomophthora muscae]|uniref:Uncharacterized protein n=1 Tax=Entomophthora muscae TaxID=34485 RepID=A0ACC2RT77_9FUNG|nr:hypothetical protein DSO57_1026004 [Entomophthora muscae]